MRKHYRYEEIKTWPVAEDGWSQGPDGFPVKIGYGASIDLGVRVGRNVRIGSHVWIEADVKIGPYAIIGLGAWIGSYARIAPDVSIGSYARIDSNVILGSRVRIEANVKIGPNVIISPDVTIDTTPFYRRGSQYYIGYCGKPGYLRFGCLHIPITEWLEKVEEIAAEHSYTPEQQVEYRGYVEEAATWMCENGVFKEENDA